MLWVSANFVVINIFVIKVHIISYRIDMLYFVYNHISIIGILWIMKIFKGKFKLRKGDSGCGQGVYDRTTADEY